MWTLSGHGLTLCTVEKFSGCTELITSVKIAYIWGTQTQVPKSLSHTSFGKVAPNISG